MVVTGGGWLTLMVQGQSEREFLLVIGPDQTGRATFDNLLVMVRVVGLVTVYVTFLYANVVGSGQ